ncbi:MAG: hypothetical protein RLY20_2402 [Verrucomicrobiota bacterium]|jgi:general secretion pathway protein J
MSPRRSIRAFTLVEVMIALAILGMVVAAIYATWRCILGATKSSQIAAAEVQRSRVAMRALEQSLTYATMHVANMRYYWFDSKNGSDASLSFVATLPDSFPRSGRFSGFPVRRVSFAVESSRDGGNDLVLRQMPILMDDFDEDERNYPLVLMKHVRKLEFGYWDARKNDWVDEWTETNQIPKLIRISLTTVNPNNAFAAGQEYFRLVSPASAAVQPGWQSAAGPGGAPPPPPPPGGVPGGLR